MSNPDASAPKGKTRSAARNDVIDAYRAILIGAVLVYHYLLRWTPNYEGYNLTHYSTQYPEWLQVGKYGVHVFFVISGIVIAMTLMRSRDVFDFAYRRLSRLYPALLVAAVTTFVLMRLIGPTPLQVTLKDFLLTLTMIPTNLGGTYVDGAYWSLAVEVKFYFWIGICYALLKQRFWIGLVAMGLIGSALEHVAHGFSVAVLLSPYMSFFLMGIAIWLLAFERNLVGAAVSGGAGALLFIVHWRMLEVQGQASPLAAAIVAGLIGLLAILTVWQVSLPLGPLPFLGRISYSLYLLHQNIGVTLIGWLKTSLGWPDFAAFAAATALAIALAVASYYLVELPAQTWLRDRYEGRLRRLTPQTSSI